MKIFINFIIKEFNGLYIVSRFVILSFFFLSILSCIPEFIIPNTNFVVRKLDLFSDIVPLDKFKELAIEDTENTMPTSVDSTAVAEVDADTISVAVDSNMTNPIEVKETKPSTETAANKSSNVVCFEDYTPDNNGVSTILERMNKVKSEGRQMRIAFLGDSFIEGDIITADLREYMQTNYGGKGVGFVPIAHVASKYRTTIKHSFEGWTTYSMVNHKNADWSKMLFSGYYFIPTENATASYAAVSNNERLSSFSTARLIFLNEKNTKITVRINASEERVYEPQPSEHLQSISFDGNIKTLDFKFSNVEGFYGYGVILNDESGVCVDNYSVRNSSGMVLSITNGSLCQDFRDIAVDYDMIVLQYGLNVASSGVTNYSNYQRTMTKVINQFKKYFPKTIFIVMGIGDRSIKSNNEMITMPGLQSMVNTQREIAKGSNVMFWDTFAAMGGENSMRNFASNVPPLAQKDYVHINKAGGKRIADAFIVSMKEILK